jgi:tryptophanyl-tRNA synthetase
MSAATDSVGAINFDPINQPGISNLLIMLALLSHKDINETSEQWKGKASYGELKQAVSEACRSFLNDLQTKQSQVDDKAILSKIETSEQVMRDISNSTLLKTQKVIGLRPI